MFGRVFKQKRDCLGFLLIKLTKFPKMSTFILDKLPLLLAIIEIEQQEGAGTWQRNTSFWQSGSERSSAGTADSPDTSCLQRKISAGSTA